MEANGQLNLELGKIKVKMQFMEEKVETDAAALKQRKIEIENLTRDHESHGLTANETINSLRQAEKNLITKIQKHEIESLRTQDKLDRVSK